MIRYVIKVKKGEELTPEQIDSIVKLERLKLDKEKQELEYKAECKKANAENFKTVTGFVAGTATTVVTIGALGKILELEENGTFTTNSGRNIVKEFISSLFRRR